MVRFEGSSMNDDAGVSTAIHQGGVRQKCPKDDHPQRARRFWATTSSLVAHIPQRVCIASRFLSRLKITRAKCQLFVSQSTLKNKDYDRHQAVQNY